MSGIEAIAAGPQMHRRRILLQHLYGSLHRQDLLTGGIAAPRNTAIGRDLAIANAEPLTNRQRAATLLFAGPRRNRDVVARILSHRLMDIGMRSEESVEFRVTLRVSRVVDQRRFEGEFFCDLRILGRKVIPGLKLGHVDFASIGGFEHRRRVAVLPDLALERRKRAEVRLQRSELISVPSSSLSLVIDDLALGE